MARWLPLLAAVATPRVPASLLAAVVAVESGGAPGAVSPAGAVGLLQVIPDGLPASALAQPAVNAWVGAHLLDARAAAVGLSSGCWRGGALRTACAPLLAQALAAYAAGPAAATGWAASP